MYCGWFWVHCSSKKFDKMAREAIDSCLKVLKESNKTKFDSYRVRNSVLIISNITFRDYRPHIFLRTRKWTIVRQWSCEKIAVLSLKPQGHVRILICRKWAIIMSWTILKGLFLSNLHLPQVDCVSAEGARDSRTGNGLWESLYRT